MYLHFDLERLRNADLKNVHWIRLLRLIPAKVVVFWRNVGSGSKRKEMDCGTKWLYTVLEEVNQERN